MHIANFIRRLAVFLNKDSRPCPAGCLLFYDVPNFLNDFISYSSTLMGKTFSYSNLSG